MKRALLAVSVVCALGWARPAAAQLDSTRIGCTRCLWRAAPDYTGTWRYEYDAPVRELRGTPAELQLIRTHLERIAELVHATPMMNPPQGVNARVWARLDLGCPAFNAALCRYKPLPGWIDIQMDGHLVNALTGAHDLFSVESPYLHIAFNDPTVITRGHKLGSDGLRDEDGNEMISQPLQVKALGGAAMYTDELVIVARNPLFHQITREHYLRGAIKTFTEYLVKERKDRAASGYGDGSFPNDDMILVAIRKELDAMSGAERSEPAYSRSSGDDFTPSNLAARGSTSGGAIVIFNPGYFDPTLPRTAIQLITVQTALVNGGPDPLDIETNGLRDVRVWELQQSIDYGKLRALLTGVAD